MKQSQEKISKLWTSSQDKATQAPLAFLGCHGTPLESLVGHVQTEDDPGSVLGTHAAFRGASLEAQDPFPSLTGATGEREAQTGLLCSFTFPRLLG